MNFLLLLVAAVLGLIPATIASRKGRSFGGWWIYGTLLFIVALIHSLVIRSDWGDVRPPRREVTCPACGKANEEKATYCRHCGAALTSEKTEA